MVGNGGNIGCPSGQGTGGPLNFEILSPKETTRARAYQMKKLWLNISGSSAEFAVAAIFWMLIPKGLFQISGDSVFISGLVYFCALLLAQNILVFPIDYISEYGLPHEFCLSNESFESWLQDRAKSLGLSCLIGGVSAGALIHFMADWPDDWWWISAVAGNICIIFVAFLAPLLIAPIFFHFKPISDAGLRERLGNLLLQMGVSVQGGLWEMDMSRRTSTVNAALVGWGPSRRVILGDTLLEFSPDEIEAVLAHELAHHVGHHIWLLIAGRCMALTAGLFFVHWIFMSPEVFVSIGAPVPLSGVPSSIGAIWIILTAFGSILVPGERALSRRLEFWCDRFAVKHISGSEAMSSVLIKLCKKNLIDPSPPAWVEFWFHSHPSIKRRIERAREG